MPLDAFALFSAEHGPNALLAAASVLFLGGLAKGAVGFALPMIAISGLGAFLPAETAVALLILPTFLSNVWQSLRGGWAAAAVEARRHRLMLLTLAPTIALSAQLLAALPDRAIFLILGVGITLFSVVQLLGLRPPKPERAPRAAAVGVGLVAGFFGGVSGVWGPPITLYLIALETPKAEQVRAMGVAFLLGSIVLTLAHSASGVLDARTWPLSLAGALPVCVGMALGFAIHDRLEPAAFRRATLLVLALAGLNLLRRGLGA